MSPMTRWRSHPDGSPTADVADDYAQRASAGLIVTEGIWPHSTGQSEAWVPGLQTGRHIDAWRRVTEAVHAAGGRIIAQLMHGERKGHPLARVDGSWPAGPSSVVDDDRAHLLDGTKADPITPGAFDRAEIAALIGHYASAAANAIAAGFDGVEIHGVNSYRRALDNRGAPENRRALENAAVRPRIPVGSRPCLPQSQFVCWPWRRFFSPRPESVRSHRLPPVPAAGWPIRPVARPRWARRRRWWAGTDTARPSSCDLP
ncbi:hypothetical protein [Nocardia sp. CA-119907]|uniref:oxidoreductase n=1 Tax=Nocardia sp. CA-119907 TaxID=3239973 RepID=UPI003D99C2DA